MRLRNKSLLLLFATMVATLLMAGSALAAPELNEIRMDNPGTDTDEYFEIKGVPGTDLTGYTYLIIGDTGSIGTCGIVEAVVDLGSLTPHVIQGDGYFAVCRNAAPTMTGYDVTGVTALNMENTDHVTHLLVTGWSGTVNTDYDTNDDGVLDATPWTTLVDCVGVLSSQVPNCTSIEYVYCATTIGSTQASVPYMVWRCEDTRAWNVGDNSLPPTGVDSPGASNQTCLLPSPSIKMEWRTPCAPYVSQAVTVTDSITGNPATATIHYQVNGGADNPVAMASIGNNKWQGTIPGQAVNGTRITYYVVATNAQGSDTGFTQGYFVGYMNIANLRVNDANGSNIYRYYGVNVRGNATSAQGTFSPTNTDFYVQDATGGINVFQFGKVVANPALGDDIEVSGRLDQFNGKLEIADSGICGDVQVTINGPGTVPTPLKINTCEMGEAYEGMLVRMQYPQVDTTLRGSIGGTTGGNWRGNRGYYITNCYPDTTELFIDADTDIDGTPVQTLQVDVTGIVSQYDTASPFFQRYEIMPRALSDIIYVTPAAANGELNLKARLFQSTPNPFSKSTNIGYVVPKASGAAATVPVRITVFDVAGRKITTLVDEMKEPGAYSVTLDATQLGGARAGIYFYDLQIDGKRVATQKLVLGQ